jgi:microcystin-dependent protein
MWLSQVSECCRFRYFNLDNLRTSTVSLGWPPVDYLVQLIYAPCAANNQEELRLSNTKWNGNAVTHKRYLDSPIINMALFNGKVVIATRKSLYFMGGQPDPGEAKDPDITNDTGKPASWIGDPEPVMTHGVFAEGDDFVFLDSYRGKLYTWLGGHVAQFDPAGEGSWKRTGPEGTHCYGGTVAGDWLVVAMQSRYGTYEAWGFDGAGWWLLFQRSAAGPAVLWPVPLAGAGNRDVCLFRDGGGTYDLLRLRWRSSTLHTYAAAGTWTSGLIDGGDPSADKAWRAIGASFAAPELRGNSASVDNVSFPLEYSLNGGATWLTAASVDSTAGSGRLFTREVTFATPPESRFLQIRQRWSSVDDWAPVLGGLWVESENAEDYALGELAQAAYEAELAAEGVLRRRWELTISASDRNVTRDGQLDAKTGRQAIAALWDAWELGTELDFKDVDNDTDPVTYLVTISGLEEKAGKPSDAARWGESTVMLVLEEGEGLGAAAGGVHAHTLDSLSDVAIAALADGHVLTWDSVAGWRNEAPAGSAPAPAAPTGTISAYAGTAAPAGWLLCDGGTVLRSSALGTLLVAAGLPYGIGDGATTVNLPNLKGRVPVGLDAAQTEFDALGEAGGAKTVTLTAAQSGLPAHEHTYQGHTHNSINRTNTGAATASNEANAGLTTTGGAAQAASQAHPNLPPYLVITYIVKD